MSGIEIALGAVALVEPIGKALRRCVKILSSTSNFQRELRLYALRAETQGTLFANECTLIIAKFVPGTTAKEAKEMMEDFKHSSWNSHQFRTGFTEHCSQFVTPISTINETLHKINHQLETMCEGMSISDKNTKSSSERLSSMIASFAPKEEKEKKPPVPSAPRRKIYVKKSEWEFGGKEALDLLFSQLERENSNLARLREQLSKEKKSSAVNSNSSSTTFPSCFPIVDLKPVNRISRVCEFSKALYNDLGDITRCLCHHIHIELQDLLEPKIADKNRSALLLDSRCNPHNDGTVCFPMLAASTNDANANWAGGSFPCEFVPMLVISELRTVTDKAQSNNQSHHEPNLLVNGSHWGWNNGYCKQKKDIVIRSVRRNLSRSKTGTSCSRSELQNEARKLFIKPTVTLTEHSTLRIAFDGAENGGRKRTFDIELEDLVCESEPGLKRARLLPMFEVAPQQRSADMHISENAPINDLCTTLAGLNLNVPGNKQLGYFTSLAPSTSSTTFASTYRHSLYSSSRRSTNALATSTSLDVVLSGTLPRSKGTTSLNMDHGARYHMAHLLASSLICFGSSIGSWFQGSWKSKDIRLFLDESTSQTTASSDDEPGIEMFKPFLRLPPATAHSTPNSSASPKAPSQYINLQLASLVIVLIELAFHKRFEVIAKETSRTGSSGNGQKSQGMEEDYDEVRAVLGSASFRRQMGRTYADLVAECFDRACGGRRLDDESMRRWFYSRIVVGLREQRDEFL
ncbi:hypothetical protein BJ508DRAFT_419104 [Ascobolus immersus RN42]|uniref:DUF7580 domain-containing protein n=1 Tax=Ascobolus immersus RN42 TaxID=1160509 RepID=A0A3N4HUF6_ASCIM|nr:hypothetical protein BJ508DRAFT_419104 [Ascobolus immersus RN42]